MSNYLFPRQIGRRQLVERYGAEAASPAPAAGEVVLCLDETIGSSATLSVVSSYPSKPFVSYWVVQRARLTPALTGMSDEEFDLLAA
jgi:hypothetical protein